MTVMINLNTLIHNVNGKPVKLKVEYNVCHKAITSDYQTFSISIDNNTIILTDALHAYQKTIKIDIKSIIMIQKFDDRFKIVTDDCELNIKIQL